MGLVLLLILLAVAYLIGEAIGGLILGLIFVAVVLLAGGPSIGGRLSRHIDKRSDGR